jgi:hypothetical protein
MTVDKSLSRGLADGILDEFKARHAGYVEALGRTLVRVPRRRADVRSMVEKLRSAGEEACLTQIIGRHPKSRWTAVIAFVPTVHKVEAGEANRLVLYEVVRLMIRTNRHTAHSGRFPIVFGIQEHAIERLFLRLNVMNAAQVREEMHDAMCLSIMLCAAALESELKQLILPTRSGVFLCGVDAEKGRLVGKTWLHATSLQPRVQEVAQTVSGVLKDYGGESGIAQWLGELPMDTSVRDIEVPEELAIRLNHFRWLHEEYSPRPDPEGETWIQARVQELRERQGIRP